MTQAENILPANLEARLPGLAGSVITEYLDDDAVRQHFLENIDDPGQHEPQWHQFGIVTHSIRAVSAYTDETPRYLEQWGLVDQVESYLDRSIDGISRADLLGTGLLFHDIGKFAARTAAERGGFTFGDHERFSGAILRSRLFDFLATEFDMSPSQREYIATCGERHYDLGILRKAAKESMDGYTFAFISGDDFYDKVRCIQEIQPSFPLEIGLLFLADNLSKTDMRLVDVESDADIETQSLGIPEVINQRALEPGLINAVKQLPVNVAVAQRYIEIYFARQAP